MPLLRLEIRNLSSTGAKRFLHAVDASAVLATAATTVCNILCPSREPTPHVRSVTLILRQFSGVAYTTSKDIDVEHKEIHFSTSYIESIDPTRLQKEITGVLVHEMVHVWQWHGRGVCNGGLIEGVADWVRLKAGLAPPHWKKRAKDCNWDSGYDVTGYFLEWLQDEFGEQIVVKMNQKLSEEYVEEEFWNKMCAGSTVDELWGRYASSLAPKDVKNGGERDDTVEGDETKDLPEHTTGPEVSK